MHPVAKVESTTDVKNPRDSIDSDHISLSINFDGKDKARIEKYEKIFADSVIGTTDNSEGEEIRLLHCTINNIRRFSSLV